MCTANIQWRSKFDNWGHISIRSAQLVSSKIDRSGGCEHEYMNNPPSNYRACSAIAYRFYGSIYICYFHDHFLLCIEISLHKMRD